MLIIKILGTLCFIFGAMLLYKANLGGQYASMGESYLFFGYQILFGPLLIFLGLSLLKY